MLITSRKRRREEIALASIKRDDVIAMGGSAICKAEENLISTCLKTYGLAPFRVIRVPLQPVLGNLILNAAGRSAISLC